MCVKQRIERVHLRQLVLVIYSQRRILRTFTDQVGSGHRVSDTRVRSGHGSKGQTRFHHFRHIPSSEQHAIDINRLAKYDFLVL